VEGASSQVPCELKSLETDLDAQFHFGRVHPAGAGRCCLDDFVVSLRDLSQRTLGEVDP
jgi:hypothetical protein